MDDLDTSDLFNGILGDVTKLASSATSAGATDIYSSITGSPIVPTAVVAQQQQAMQQKNSQLLFLLLIAFAIYYVVKQ